MPTKASRKAIETAIFMFFIVLAGFLQYYDISLPPFYAQTFSYLANTIFLILIFIWGKSIRQRIIQKGIRRKLVIIAVLLFFWLFLCLARIFLPLSNIGTTPRGCGTKKLKYSCLLCGRRKESPGFFFAGMQRRGPGMKKWRFLSLKSSRIKISHFPFFD